MHSHHATTRIAFGIAGIVLIGLGIYLVLAYQQAHTTAQATTGTSSSTVTFPVAAPTTSKPAPTSGGGLSSGAAPTHATMPTDSADIVVTASDANTTVPLIVGETFTLQFGNTLNHSVSFDPNSAVKQIAPADETKGTQGTYKAVQAGTINLDVTGSPICTPGHACPQFIQMQHVTFNVK